MAKRSKIIENILEKNHREYIDDANAADEYLKERSAEEDETYKIPKKIYHTKVESKNLFGCQMITFNDVKDTEHMVIYLHGGIYVNEIRLPHISFCDRLAKKSTGAYSLRHTLSLQTILTKKPIRLLKNCIITC